jgi:multidrug resistance efflux pump
VPHSSQIEKVVRSRAARLSLAAALLALGFWAFSPYIGSRVASSAFVNSELVRVTSPIAGRLTQNLPSRGDFVTQSRTVDLVEAIAIDQRHLFDLREQHEVAKRRTDLARTQLREVETSDRELADRTAAYQAGMINRITHEIAETNIENKGCLAESQQRHDVGARMEALVKLGIASQIRSSEAIATREMTAARCGMSNARVERLTDELKSAERGIFLRDGANDAPYSRQQRDRLLLRRQELESELLNQSSKAGQLVAAIKEEQARLLRANRFELALPAGYVVWSTAASPGSTVVAGQTVTDLADCRRRFVAVEMPERDFEQIKGGDRAAVRLVGSDTWVYGSVRQEQGSAARTDDRLLAARVSKPSSGSITVEIELPSDVWAEDRQRNFCDIGRLAEVRFPRSATGLLSLLHRLTRNTSIASN